MGRGGIEPPTLGLRVAHLQGECRRYGQFRASVLVDAGQNCRVRDIVRDTTLPPATLTCAPVARRRALKKPAGSSTVRSASGASSRSRSSETRKSTADLRASAARYSSSGRPSGGWATHASMTCPRANDRASARPTAAKGRVGDRDASRGNSSNEGRDMDPAAMGDARAGNRFALAFDLAGARSA
jgi:hypothetical protein